MRIPPITSLLAPLALAAALSAAPAPRLSTAHFEQNVGQGPSAADYLARGLHYRTLLDASGASIAIDQGRGSTVLRIETLGANRDAEPIGVERLQASTHYLKGRSFSAPLFRQVRYRGVYPGVDALYRSTAGRLEYDFYVAPGADPDQIRLRFHGVDELQVGGDGSLAIRVGEEWAEQPAPVIYQDGPDGRRQIEGAHRLADNGDVVFRVGDYDPTLTLVIDPVLDVSTYLGAGDEDQANGIAVDSDGSVYVVGTTESSDFPVSGAVVLPNFGGDDSDAFVSKFDADGNLLFSTFYGSESSDAGMDIAVGEDGSVYLTGWTESENLPTTGFMTDFAGVRDCFVAKLAPDGSAITHASYLGHGDEDACNAIAVNDAGEVYVAGYTRSLDFPTTDGAVQTDQRGERDAFVAKVSADGLSVVWATLLGGVADDTAYDLALDADGGVVVVGDTSSNGFPVSANARQNVRRAVDGFLVRLAPDGDVIDYGSFIGGTTDDLALGVALGPNGEIHVVGETDSIDIELSSRPLQSVLVGDETDAFLSVFDASGGELMYSTLLGGGERDFANSVAVDAAGRIYIVGGTESVDFPFTETAILPEYRGDTDAFYVQFERSGLGILQSTFFGGEDEDEAKAVAVGENGNIYMAGLTRSDNLPLSDNPFQNTFTEGDIGLFGQPTEAFVTTLAALPAERPFSIVSAASFRSETLAGGSIVSGFGMNLADVNTPAPSVPLPTELGGIRVQVTGDNGVPRDAELFFAGPEQINFALPDVAGPEDLFVEVIKDGEVIASGAVRADLVAPAVFSATASGGGVAAANVVQVRNGEQSTRPVFNADTLEADPIDLEGADDTVIELYGTGLRNAAEITATVNGQPVEVLFAGPAPGFVGLDQINVRIPAELAGSGDVDIEIMADGITANTVTVNLL